MLEYTRRWKSPHIILMANFGCGHKSSESMHERDDNKNSVKRQQPLIVHSQPIQRDVCISGRNEDISANVAIGDERSQRRTATGLRRCTVINILLLASFSPHRISDCSFTIRYVFNV
ncbi:hypothetical protein CHS0354_036390 [Potamilus streckersoni]|uniref:Uncharacterized protein n=1 Tax=Potamilus streckersoni TaxID=2493646 RepID=A0AAE0SXC8_9BIVA|nr:hypothetical protein CHS0354_036390 [Potamilus streckersoni]